jgi:hypothetical protein
MEYCNKSRAEGIDPAQLLTFSRGDRNGQPTIRVCSDEGCRSATRAKTVVVTFGGGARDEETFAPEGQENIPHLMNGLIPQATFCTQGR